MGFGVSVETPVSKSFRKRTQSQNNATIANSTTLIGAAWLDCRFSIEACRCWVNHSLAGCQADLVREEGSAVRISSAHAYTSDPEHPDETDERQACTSIKPEPAQQVSHSSLCSVLA